MYDKDTDELFEELKIQPDVENFLAENFSELTIPLHEYLNKILQKKKLSKSEIVKQLNFDRNHAYHIFAGDKKPSRQKLLAISRAMNLNLDETQYLLRYAGFAILYPRNAWDAVIISAIQQNLSVRETNYLLEQLGEKTFTD